MSLTPPRNWLLIQNGQMAFGLGLAFLLGRWLVTGGMKNGLFRGLSVTWQGLAFAGGSRLTFSFGMAVLILSSAFV